MKKIIAIPEKIDFNLTKLNINKLFILGFMVLY